MDNENKLEPIMAVSRALQVLELIGKNGSISLNDLHIKSKINKASLLRITYTLVEEGYAKKDEHSGDYSLTLKAYEVGLSAIHSIDKMSLINSTLNELNEKTGRIAQFSIEDNNSLLCLQSINRNNTLFSVYSNIGSRSPLYCTSAGKAILSAYSNTEILDKWEKMDVRGLTDNTITNFQDFIADLSATRKRGYALDLQENELGMCCIGAVVMGPTAKPVGAISLSGQVFRDINEIESVAEILLPAVSRLSGMMGYINML